jgi:hypothetical protein
VRRYDWEYLRHKYVAGDATLEDLAAPGDAPALDTLKKRSARDGWADQRAAYRHQTSTRTRELASTSEAEVAARHVKVAKALQHKALERLQTLKPEELAPRDLLAFIKEAADIERKALGLDVQKVEHSGSVNVEGAAHELAERIARLTRGLDGRPST